MVNINKLLNKNINLPSFNEFLNSTLIKNRNYFIFYNNLFLKRSRRYFEVKRFFKCNFKNCNKSYGTLNHLNTHILLKNHGKKLLLKNFN